MGLAGGHTFSQATAWGDGMGRNVLARLVRGVVPWPFILCLIYVYLLFSLCSCYIFCFLFNFIDICSLHGVQIFLEVVKMMKVAIHHVVLREMKGDG